MALRDAFRSFDATSPATAAVFHPISGQIETHNKHDETLKKQLVSLANQMLAACGPDLPVNITQGSHIGLESNYH